MSLTVYTLTVAIEADEHAPEDTEERTLTAQLRLAAQAVAGGSAPTPGDVPRYLARPGEVGTPVTTILTAVVL